MEKNTNKAATSCSKGLLQSEELNRYVLETSVFPREAEALKDLRDVTANHPQAMMGTAPEAGQVIAMLLKLVDAKKSEFSPVILFFSLLLPFLMMGIDMNRESYEIGLPVIQRAGVDHKIEFIESEALPVLDQLLKDERNEGSFDFAFVDADKVNFWKYHERLMKLLKVSGHALDGNGCDARRGNT